MENHEESFYEFGISQLSVSEWCVFAGHEISRRGLDWLGRLPWVPQPLDSQSNRGIPSVTASVIESLSETELFLILSRNGMLGRDQKLSHPRG